MKKSIYDLKKSDIKKIEAKLCKSCYGSFFYTINYLLLFILILLEVATLSNLLFVDINSSLGILIIMISLLFALLVGFLLLISNFKRYELIKDYYEKKNKVSEKK